MNRPRVVAGVMLLTLSGSPTAAQAPWAQFRGPNAGDVGDNPALPETWSETENVVWTIDVPGLAWSSPVVWGDHIFITSAISAGDEPDPIPGLYDPGDDNGSRRSTQQHRWVVYDIDFDTGALLS